MLTNRRQAYSHDICADVYAGFFRIGDSGFVDGKCAGCSHCHDQMDAQKQVAAEVALSPIVHPARITLGTRELVQRTIYCLLSSSCLMSNESLLGSLDGCRSIPLYFQS